MALHEVGGTLKPHYHSTAPEIAVTTFQRGAPTTHYHNPHYQSPSSPPENPPEMLYRLPNVYVVPDFSYCMSANPGAVGRPNPGVAMKPLQGQNSTIRSHMIPDDLLQ